MDDYGTGWASAHGGAIEALDRVFEVPAAPGVYEQRLRSELDKLVEEAEGEKDVEGEILEGLQEGARIHRKRLREILDGEGDWEEKRPHIYEALDELSNPPDSDSKLRKDLGLD